MHPNTMDFSAFSEDIEIGHLRVESIGGGDIRIAGDRAKADSEDVYIEHSFAEIADFCKRVFDINFFRILFCPVTGDADVTAADGFYP